MKPVTCTSCPWYNGKGFVLANKVDAPLLIVIGEAPGETEVDQGLAFVGMSGRQLRKNVLEAAGWDVERVIFDNVLRCLVGKSGNYPTGKKRDEAEEFCRQYDILERYPDTPVLLVGAKAIGYYMGTDLVSRMHGHIARVEGRWWGCTYHPAAAVRDPVLFHVMMREAYNLRMVTLNPDLYKEPNIKKGYLPGDANPSLITFDLEWNKETKELTVIGAAFDKEERIYTSYIRPETKQRLVDYISRPGVVVAGQNIIEADLPQLGVEVPASRVFDTKIAAHILFPNFANRGLYNLGSLTRMYYPASEWKTDKADYLKYNGTDVFQTQRLVHDMKHDLEMTQQYHLLEKEQSLAMLSVKMRKRGIKVDKEGLTQHATEMELGREDFKKSFPFNPNSPAQIKQYFRTVGIRLRDTERETLLTHSGGHPLIDKLITYKLGTKVLGTWFPVEVHDGEVTVDERMFPEFNITGTNVARWSGMQNLPRKGMGQISNYRRYITASSPDHWLISLDAKQIENRTVAYEAQCQKMLDDFASGVDFHRLAAARSQSILRGYTVLPEDITTEERNFGKSIIHASNYLESERNLSLRLFGDQHATHVLQARELQNAYFSAYPEIRTWQNRVVDRVSRGETLCNAFGRKRQIVGLDRTKLGKQGCHFYGCSDGADHVNQRMLDIYHALGKIPIMVIHDELVYDEPRDIGLVVELKRVFEQPCLEMGGMIIPTEPKVGDNFLDMEVLAL